MFGMSWVSGQSSLILDYMSMVGNVWSVVAWLKTAPLLLENMNYFFVYGPLTPKFAYSRARPGIYQESGVFQVVWGFRWSKDWGRRTGGVWKAQASEARFDAGNISVCLSEADGFQGCLSEADGFQGDEK